MYIKLMIEENKNNYVSLWLLLITLLVGLMIIVGGLTRLTDSGLSITRWNLLSGIIPPLNTHSWENAFALYKEIPEYKLLNFSIVSVLLHNQLDHLARHARFADRLESRAGFHDHSDRTLLRAVQIGNQAVPTASHCYLADSR